MNDADGKSSNLFLGIRCFTNDVITSFCFARSVDAMSSPGFEAPIIKAMGMTGPTFLIFKNFPLFRRLILAISPWVGLRISPVMAGIFRFEQMLRDQVTEVITHPKLLENAPHPIIYHELLKPGKKDAQVPSFVSLFEEAKTLVFAGSDTLGNTLMIGMFHVLENSAILLKVKKEVLQTWPVLSECPKYEELEKLPYLVTLSISI